MKRILILFAFLFLAGCATVKDSGFYEHKTVYASFDHMKFSVYGYKNPKPSDFATSKAQGWWGIPIDKER